MGNYAFEYYSSDGIEGIHIRNESNTNPIQFTWASDDATIQMEKSINGSPYTSVLGTSSFLRSEGEINWYTLTYNQADRAAGVVRYRATDGVRTKHFNLTVLDDVRITQQDIAAAILLNPSNKILTNSSGHVTSTEDIDPRRTITVLVKDNDNIAVPSCPIWVSGLVKTKYTNQNGFAHLYLLDGTYEILIETPLGYSDIAPFTLVVSSNQTIEKIAAKSIITPPINPELCGVQVNVISQYGQNLNGVSVWADAIKDLTSASDSIILDTNERFISANGYVVLELIKGVKYRINILYLEKQKTLIIMVPTNQNTLILTEIL